MENNYKTESIPQWDGNVKANGNELPPYVRVWPYPKAVPENEDEYRRYNLLKKLDQNAYWHEGMGMITQAALGAILGTAAGIGAGALLGNGFKSDYIRPLGALGTALGTVGGVGAYWIGNKLGRDRGSLNEREKYLTGTNTWKHYLIPGYAGYQAGSRVHGNWADLF